MTELFFVRALIEVRGNPRTTVVAVRAMRRLGKLPCGYNDCVATGEFGLVFRASFQVKEAPKDIARLRDSLDPRRRRR